MTDTWHDPHQEKEGRRTLDQIHKSSTDIKGFEITAWNEGYEMNEIEDFIERKFIAGGDKTDK